VAVLLRGLFPPQLQQLAERLPDGGDLVLILVGEDDAPAGFGKVGGIHPLLDPQRGHAVPLVPGLELGDVILVQFLPLGDLGDGLDRHRGQQIVAAGAVDAIKHQTFHIHTNLLLSFLV
jgi:hypothetical protein